MPLTGRSLGLCAITADPVCEGHTTVLIIGLLISAFLGYRTPLHVYILTQKFSTTCEYGAYTFGWSDKISGHRSLNAIVLWDKVDSIMVKKRNLPPLLSFSALLVCILPHCQLRDWCGNLRKASGHVVCRLDQSASFRIFDSAFYFPHSTLRNSAFYP